MSVPDPQVLAAERDDLRGARFAELFGPLTAVSARDALAGLGMWSQAPELGAFDAVLSAVAISHAWDLMSAERSFAELDEVKWTDLAEY